jgi:tetratricopeptide (TPR) repeat protein
MKPLLLNIWMILPVCLMAQAGNSSLRAGNKAYREHDFTKAEESYRKAIDLSPANATAKFNLGDALFRGNRPIEAQKAFESVIVGSNEPKMIASAWYNKGVSLTAQQKLEESIDAYKNVLRIDPSDTMARDNLQRAMNELKRRRDQEQQQQKKQQEQKKMSRQQVQQLLQALQDQERMLQQKINHSRVPSPSQPEKDW